MLQISQIEKPTCSATIDQMRLRVAIFLPFESQKFLSSGFQSEIQVGSDVLIAGSFSAGFLQIGFTRSSQGVCQAYFIEIIVLSGFPQCLRALFQAESR